MSLDIWLISEKPVKRSGSGIFVRLNGQTKEITREEWGEMHHGREPVVFNGDEESHELYTDNITHNLGRMAREVELVDTNLYMVLWRPDELGLTVAAQLTGYLQDGYHKLTADPERYSEYNPENGWGNYDGLVRFTGEYLLACLRHPSAKIEVSR
jgi:hypothetical protein